MRLSRETSFDGLCRVVSEKEVEILQYPLCDDVPLDAGIATPTVDALSLELYPPDAPDSLTPVCIYGDGNCLPRCLSLLVLGHQEAYHEMRVRIVMELTLNIYEYLDPAVLRRGRAPEMTFAKCMRCVQMPTAWRF